MRRFVLGVGLGVAAAATSVASAWACSCAVSDPRSALKASDGAFVGVLVGTRSGGVSPATGPLSIHTFRVEEVLKGGLGAQVEVESASTGAACGLEVVSGDRVGLLLDRHEGRWTSNLCMQLAANTLRAAARPLPRPTGRGATAFLVGGRFAPARTMALDARGRTLAYGTGRGETMLLSVCPGGRRVAELVSDGSARLVAVRALPGLRLIRERRIPLDAGAAGNREPSALFCADGAGASVYVFATNAGFLRAASSRILRITPRRTAAIHVGAGSACAFAAGRAYLASGPGGRRLVAVRLPDGRARTVASVPDGTGALVVSPDARRLAGVVSSGLGRPALPTRAVVVTLGSRPTLRSSSVADPTATGTIAWLDSTRLVFFPAVSAGPVRTLDLSLRTVATVRGWSALAAAVRSGVGMGIAGDVLTSVPLPRGPARVVRRLPSPLTRAIVAVPPARARAAASLSASGGAW